VDEVAYALPSGPIHEQCLGNKNYYSTSFAGVLGLEPRRADPETAGLPITPYPTGLFL
jgi:hypothetical protein